MYVYDDVDRCARRRKRIGAEKGRRGRGSARERRGAEKDRRGQGSARKKVGAEKGRRGKRVDAGKGRRGKGVGTEKSRRAKRVGAEEGSARERFPKMEIKASKPRGRSLEKSEKHCARVKVSKPLRRERTLSESERK